MTVRAPMIGTDTDSAETFRQAMSGLWVPASATNVRTGVTSVPTLTGTGNFTATVSPFTMVIDGTSNVLQAGYPVANDSAATITVTAANAQPRIDLICLQIQDNAYDGSGFSRGQFFVVAGAPSGSPAAPATPANAIPLWTVPVAANATSVVFSSATAVFPFTAAAGGIVYVRGATDKPAVANGVQYRHRGDVVAGGVSPLEWSTDGTTYTPVFDPTPYQYTWTTFATVWTGGGTSIGNGTLVMRYMKIGRIVWVRVSLNIGSTTNLGTGTWNFSLPFTNAVVGMITGAAVAYCGSTNPGYYGTCEVVGNTCVAIMGTSSSFVTPTSPATWVTNNNNSLDMTFFYESTT